MRFCMYAVLVALVSSTISCGALFVGTTQTVHINSSPVNSKIELDGGIYRSPASVVLARNKNYTVTISKEGYETRSVKINRTVSGGIVILDVLAGVFPVIIDMVMGTWYKLSPNTINVNLVSTQSGKRNVPVNISIVDKDGISIKSAEPVKIKIKVSE